jgi:hypothetical protein
MTAINQHRNLTGVQLHNPKGFDEATNNTRPFKNGNGDLVWVLDSSVESALDYVSPQSAPPTEVNGDIYLLDDTGTSYDINTIAWQSGNTVRITFNGSPDLSAVAANDYFITSGNANTSNDGTFVITAVDNSTKYFDITNNERSDATDDEAADAAGTGYYVLEEWDAAPKGSHVKFDGSNWVSSTVADGVICYDQTASAHRYYSASGANWDNTIASSGGVGDVTKVGTPVDNQVGVWTGDGTIEGKTDFTYSNGAMNTVGEDASAYMRLTSYSDTLHWTNNITFRSANGTSGTPTALLINEDLGSFIAQGHNGTAFVASGNEITWSAAENWSSGNNGVKLEIKTTPNGSASSTQRILIDGNGKTSISTALNIPNGATPTIAADGDIGIDTTVTDFSTGIMKYYGGEEMGVVAMPIAQFTTPTDGHVVAYNATNDEFELVAASGGGISNVVDDTTPQLGGSLDVNGNKIVSVSNGNIDIEPDGTGNVLLGNFTFDADQTVGAGQDDYVLTYDNTSGLISLEAASGGGGGSLWTDDGGGKISYSDAASGVEVYETGFPNTYEAAVTVRRGFMMVGEGHNVGHPTTATTVGRSALFGGDHNIGNVGNTDWGFIAGYNNTIEEGYYNIILGNGSTIKNTSDNAISIGRLNNITGSAAYTIGNSNTLSSSNATAIGSALTAGYSSRKQILVGDNINIAASWANKGFYVGFGVNVVARPSFGLTRSTGLSDSEPLNLCMGSISAVRNDTGGARTNAGSGVFWQFKGDTIPTANPANGVAHYTADRTTNKAGYEIKVEDGTKHFFGDFSVIGGDNADANANKVLTIAGSGTGSGTSSLLCEDSAGASNLEVKDNGVVNMANLPTSSAGLSAGDLWNNSGVINIV